MRIRINIVLVIVMMVKIGFLIWQIIIDIAKILIMICICREINVIYILWIPTEISWERRYRILRRRIIRCILDWRTCHSCICCHGLIRGHVRKWIRVVGSVEIFTRSDRFLEEIAVFPLSLFASAYHYLFF